MADDITCIIEAILFAANKPLSEKQLLNFFPKNEKPALGALRGAIFKLKETYEDRGIELVEVASGYRFQVKQEYSPWVNNIWEEKAPKFSRAFLETISIIAYRQPITRSEIEDIRGVAISSSIFKTLLDEKGWIRLIGHRDVPGRPGLYGTTQKFLDYLGLKKLDQLPSLPEIHPITELTPKDGEEETTSPENLELEFDEDSQENEEELENNSDDFNEEKELDTDIELEDSSDDFEDEDFDDEEELEQEIDFDEELKEKETETEH